MRISHWLLPLVLLALQSAAPPYTHRLVPPSPHLVRPPLAGVQSARHDAPARRFVRKTWKPLWRRGGKGEEDLFALPREIVASSTGVFVADPGGLEVFAFAATGALRWKSGRNGGGPGEYRALTDITLDATGNATVLDAQNARVTWLGPTGRVERTASTAALGWPTGLCMFGNGSLLLTHSEQQDFFLFASGHGELQRTLSFPWPTEASAPTFLRSSHMARGVAGATCWLATTFGFGLARVPALGAATVSPFIETVPAPIIRTVPSTPERKGGQFLEKGDNAALAAFTDGDTLFVQFMGQRTPDKPLLDLYDQQGRYIESWNLPDVERVAYSHGVLYTLENAMESPTLMAWRAVASPRGR